MAGAFQSGFNMGQNAWNTMQKNALAEQEMQLRKEAAARDAEQFGWRRDSINRENAAAAQYAIDSTGVAPSQLSQIKSTYGMNDQQLGAASAGGTAGLKAKLASYDAPDSYDLQSVPPAASGLPKRFTSDQVSGRELSDLERLQARRALAIGTRDFNQIPQLDKDEKAFKLEDGRRAEFARLNKLSPEALVETLGGEFSRDGSGVDAMLTYDEKANKYLFASKVPGMPSRTLSKPELMRYALGLWEAGNGDLAAGMQAQIDGIRTQRELRKEDAARAATLASGNADLFFKKLTADNDAARTNAVSRYYDAQIERYKKESEASNWGTEQYIDKDGNISVYDVNRKSKTPDFRLRTMPPGLKPYNPRPVPELKVNPDGSVIQGSDLFVPDPKTPGKYVKASGFGPSALDLALKNYKGGEGQPGGLDPTGFVPSSTKYNITAPSTTQFVGPADNFIRTSKRGLFGGLSYEYLDPVSGKTFSMDEYNRMVGGN